MPLLLSIKLCCFPPSTHLSNVNYDAQLRTGHCMSPRIWYKIHGDVLEISIVSSWALTVVFHCEYQPWRWWISPFSSCHKLLQTSVMSEPVCRPLLSRVLFDPRKPHDILDSSYWWIISHRIQGPFTEWCICFVDTSETICLRGYICIKKYIRDMWGKCSLLP